MTEPCDNKSDSKTVVFVDDDRNTDLHYAAALGKHEEVVKELENGHKVDPENYLGWTPLMMAARHGHLDVVETFLENRADSTRRNKFGYSVFHVTIVNGKLELIVLILQHLLRGGISRKSMEGVLSPISLAVLFSHSHILQILIDQSFDVNSPTTNTGITPLMFATATGNSEIFNFLVSRGAESDPNTNGPKISDILRMKQKHVVNNRPPCPAHHVSAPLMIVHSPQPVMHQQPYVPMSPSPYSPFLGIPRKCSDLESPLFLTPISPIPPVSVATPFSPFGYPYPAQQIFFPSDFSPSQVSPMHNNFPFNQSNFLNRTLHQSSFLVTYPQFSPVNGTPY